MSVLQLVCFSPSDMHPPNFDTPWLRHDCDHPLWPQSWNYMNSVSLRRSLRIFIGSKRAVHEWDNSIWYSIKYDDRYNHMFTNHQYFTNIWSIWGGFPQITQLLFEGAVYPDIDMMHPEYAAHLHYHLLPNYRTQKSYSVGKLSEYHRSLPKEVMEYSWNFTIQRTPGNMMKDDWFSPCS